MYQPQPANTAPTQVPPPGQYGSQAQPPVQIFNPASKVTPGAPFAHPPPSVTPPPPGPPPTGMIKSYCVVVFIIFLRACLVLSLRC